MTALLLAVALGLALLWTAAAWTQPTPPPGRHRGTGRQTRTAARRLREQAAR